MVIFFCFRDHFYQFGEIRSITMVPRQMCAFIQYVNRIPAELAAEKTFNKLILGGRRLNIKWGKSQGRTNAAGGGAASGEDAYEPVPGLPGALPPPPVELARPSGDFFNLGGDGLGPSMPPPPPPQPLMPPPPPMFAIGPHGAPPFFFPSAPRYLPGPAPPPLCPPGTAPPLPPEMAPLAPPGTTGPPGVHYPSQDPRRLGTSEATKAPAPST